MNANWYWKAVVRAAFIATVILFATQTEPAYAQATQAVGAAKPRIGGILKFGIVKDIGTPIPFVAYTSIGQYVKDNVYEPLVMFDRKGEIQPWLAESWSANANSTEWTFKIRRGVKFHDGRELTANDVVWSAKHIIVLLLSLPPSGSEPRRSGWDRR
jgi:ABC-type transport system substrate-binding protein